MLEKNSTLILTPSEIRSVQAGILPERLSRDWGLSLAELANIIEFQNCKISEEAIPRGADGNITPTK